MRDNMKKEELFEPFRHNFDYYFYYKYIAHLENNYGIKIQDIMNYIKDNNVILEENGLIRYLFERRMFDVFNKYVDIFVNNGNLFRLSFHGHVNLISYYEISNHFWLFPS